MSVAQVRVRAGVQQNVDHVLIEMAVVAEDDGLELRRPAKVVDVVDVIPV